MIGTTIVQSESLEIAVGRWLRREECCWSTWLCRTTAATSFSKLLDLNMLVMTGGRERTKAEFRALLDAADYKLTRIVPTMAPQSVIEAVPKSRLA